MVAIDESDALPDHVAALLQPSAYPFPVERIDLIQTHISWVLLAGDSVFKLKKPVDFGFLNFTTLARRRYYCRQEVVLNQRLCPDTYLGVVPVGVRDGRYRLGDDGAIVDYAVQMRRLPADRMLDRLLASGVASGELIDAIADILARFHDTSETSAVIARYGSLATIRHNWEENFEQTAPFVGETIAPAQYAYLRAYVTATLRRKRALFRERVRAGRIRDCHGDLRASSICCCEPVCIYDCIEFNRRFRYGDVAADVAFLAMDLDAMGDRQLAARFVERYVAAADDRSLADVLDFYRCYRAFVRGKVDSFQVNRAGIGSAAHERVRAAAHRRFALAVEYAIRDRPPVLIVMCGLSGTGKSTLARNLAGPVGASVIASDMVRKELAGQQPTEHRGERYGTGIYTPTFTTRTYRELLRRARRLLDAGRSVILDATFSRREWRDRARRLAQSTGALCIVLECRTADDEVRRRLLARVTDPTAASDANWQIYLSQRAAAEPIIECDPWQHVVIDTTGELLDVIARTRTVLDEHLNPAPTDRILSSHDDTLLEVGEQRSPGRT